MTNEGVDAVATEIGTEIIPAAAPASNLFHTDDPLEVVERASRVAEALKGVLVSKGMLQPISGKDHVKVEGWQTLGAMLGVVPVVEWTRKVERGWEARVEARTLDGRIVGAAEAMCLKDEARWKDSDEYAIRSMAQTRATSKALSGPLRFVVTLAGYESTPAEEMDGVRSSGGSSGRAGRPSDPQKKLVQKLAKQKGMSLDDLSLLVAQVTATENVPLSEGWMDSRLSGGKEGTASALIDRLIGGPIPSASHPSDVPSDPSEFELPPVADPLPVEEGAA